MSAEVATSVSGMRSRPSTRSSIRHSLNLASVGKAIADVMHKDSKEGERKPKETSSKRSSLVPTASKGSSDRVGATSKKDRDSPDMKTISRHSRKLSVIQRVSSSGTSSEDQSSSPSSKVSVTRASSLRPRSSLGTSALPKYRPKSAVLVESNIAKHPPSPAKSSVRRKLSDSEEDERDAEEVKSALTLDVSPVTLKRDRPISPLPHRGALRVNLSAAINVRPATPEKKSKTSTPTPQASPSRLRGSPTRMTPTSRLKPSTKSSKDSKPASASTIRAPAARPSSAASVGTIRTPCTPGTPTAINRGSGRSGVAFPSSSPLRTGLPPQDDSPLGKLSARQRKQNESPSPSPAISRAPSFPMSPPIILTQENSIDSMDANDVELMLSTVISPTSSTPALPRLRRTAPQPTDSNPHTPVRSSPFLPSRANLSYLSPAPPDADESPFLRPRMRGTGGIDRGSIMSWEQLAQHNRSMGIDDVENMLCEVDAPFGSAAASPALSALTDIPESPSLSAMPSPTGYGSISQVLLPDVTPSPATHSHQRFDEMTADVPAVDGAIVTLLKLQLASAEETVAEHLLRIQNLEAQLKAAKEARLHDAEELARQISELEEQVVASTLPDAQLQQYAANLEEQVAHAQTAQEQAVSEALKKAETEAATSRATALCKQQARFTAATVACEASSAWSSVKDVAQSELEIIRSNRDMLEVLLASLDRMQL